MYQKTNIFLRCTMVSREEEKGKVLEIGEKMKCMGAGMEDYKIW